MDNLIRRKDVMKVFTTSSDGKRISEIDIDGFCTSVNIRDVKCYIRNVPSVTKIDGVNIQEAVEKQIPQAVVADGNDESGWVYCPACDEILGINESVFNAFQESSGYIYCPSCGQKLREKQYWRNFILKIVTRIAALSVSRNLRKKVGNL